MLAPSRLMICPLAAIAVVASGCGSSEKTTSTRAGTTAPSQTTTQSTGSTQAPRTASKPRARKTTPPVTPEVQKKAVEAQHHVEQKIAEKSPIHKLQAAAGAVPRKKQYSIEEQTKFMGLCEKANGGSASHLKCECVLVKQELRKLETGQTLAELLALEFALQQGVSLSKSVHGVPFPHGKVNVNLPHTIHQSVEECR
jgi:hypothetical protein